MDSVLINRQKHRVLFAICKPRRCSDPVVSCWSLPQAVGEFVLTDRNMRIKPRGKIYSLNEGYARSWFDPVKEWVESKKNPEVNATFYCILLFVLSQSCVEEVPSKYKS